MILLSWVRWFRGWVCFSVSQDNSGRFLTNAGSRIWNVHKKGDTLVGFCYPKDYCSVAREGKNSGCKIKVIERRGLPFWRHRYRFRWGLLIGAIMALILLFCSTFFVWSIDVNGNLLLKDDDILKASSDQGLHEGALRFSFNTRDIEYALMEQFPEIAWVSINRSGTHYDIEISESTPKPQIQNNNTPCNVVSKSDAVIREVEAYNGTAMVAPGDVVSQNQLLVSGVKEFENSEVVHYTHASAKIIGETQKTLDYQLPLSISVPKKTGEIKEKKRMRMFGFEIPLSIFKTPENFSDCHTETKQIHFLGFSLPIYVQTTYYELTEEVKIENDKDEVRRVLINNAKSGEENELKGCKILSRKFSFEETAEGITLHATYIVEEDIGSQVPIVSENSGEE